MANETNKTAKKTTVKKTPKEALPVDNTPAGKSARFKKIAGRRVQKLVTGLKNLGNCANKNVYGYSPEQVEYIFTMIEKQLKTTKEKFAEKVEAAAKTEIKIPD